MYPGHWASVQPDKLAVVNSGTGEARGEARGEERRAARAGARGGARARGGGHVSGGRGPLSRAAAAVAMAAHALRHYSLAHPFLVADNRHFPFYLWRRVLDRYPDRPWLRACLAPA